MSYTTENFTVTATDNVTPVLNRAAVAATQAGVKITAFGETLRNSAEAGAALSAAGGNAARTVGAIGQSAARSEKELKALRSELKEVSAASEKSGKSGGVGGALLELGANATMAFNGVKSVVQSLAKPFREAFRFEDVATRLAPVLGGLDKSRAMAAHLRKEAANGTMSFEQLASVAGRLGAVFSSTENIKTWTSAFHNLAAATGLDVNELIGNFVKMKAAGRVTGEFPEMFAQKGVNIFGELEKQTGKSAAELRQMATAGTLAFSDIEAALLSLTTGTGKFATAAADMSNNAGGSVATLAAEWDILLAKFAEPLAQALTPAVQFLSKIVAGIGDAAETAFGKAGIWLVATGTAAAACAKSIRGVGSALKLATSAWRGFGRAAKIAMGSIGIGAVFIGLGALFEWISAKKDALEDEAARAEEEVASAKDKAAQAERERKARAERARAEREREEQAARARYDRARDRAESIAREFDKASEAVLRANAAAQDKIKTELQIVGLESVEALSRELRDLSFKATLSFDGLTEEESARAKELLNTQRAIAAIEEKRRAASRSLGERVFLLEAELKGAEALAAAKEKIYRNTLRQKVAEAAPEGTTADEIEEKVNDILYLEKSVEEKRKTEALVEKMDAQAERLNLKRAKASGNTALYEQTERYYREKAKIKELMDAGYSRADAEAEAREESTLDAAISGKNTQLVKAGEIPPAATVPVQSTAAILPAALFAGAKSAADNTLTVSARETAHNTAAILAELRKPRQPSTVPAIIV